MYIVCPNCCQTCESDNEPEIGQHLLCPFCSVVFNYAPQEAEEKNPDDRRDKGIDIIAPRYEHSKISAAHDIKQTIKSVSHRIRITKKPSRFHANISQSKGASYVAEHNMGAQEGARENIRSCLPRILFVLAALVVAVFPHWISTLISALLALSAIFSGYNKFCIKTGRRVSVQEFLEQSIKYRLLIALFVLATLMVIVVHHWVSVLMSVGLAFAAILMHIYNRLCAKMGARATKSDFIRHLGFGAPSVFLSALVLVSCFIMYSCDFLVYTCRSQQEKMRLQAEFDRSKWVDNAMQKHALCFVTCDMCDFRETKLLNIYEILNKKIVEPITKERCPHCRHWLFYNIWRDRRHFQQFYDATNNDSNSSSVVFMFMVLGFIALIVIVAINKSRKDSE